MRTKSESRREAILDIATRTFCERGYDATSMSEVAARLGGSKATLYNYFDSKETLFAAVMVEEMREQANPIVEAFCNAKKLGPAIGKLTPAFIRLKLQPDVIAIGRMCIAEGERCGFGPAVYNGGPKPAFERMAARVKQAMDEGELRQADPWRAILHLMALCTAGPVDARLHGWSGPPTNAEIEETAAAATDAFLRAYRPD